MRREEMALKFLDRDRAARVVGQKRRRDSLHLAAKQAPLDQRSEFHQIAAGRRVFASFKRNAMTDFL